MNIFSLLAPIFATLHELFFFFPSASLTKFSTYKKNTKEIHRLSMAHCSLVQNPFLLVQNDHFKKKQVTELSTANHHGSHDPMENPTTLFTRHWALAIQPVLELASLHQRESVVARWDQKDTTGNGR